MLSPEARSVAMDLLRPPTGARLDSAYLTTYSLDLEALLALPLAVFAQADKSVDELLGDPLLLLEGIREAGSRVHVFADAKAIGIPRQARTLYAVLEPSVHPVKAPNGGAFHPKVWVARFVREDGPPILRVAILSRNLTFDRSWDVALVTEASPAGERRVGASVPLADLIRGLPELAVEPLAESTTTGTRELAEELERTRFPGPEGFDSPVEFVSFGLTLGRKRAWRPLSGGLRLMAIAPFVNQTALRELKQASVGEHLLVSRQEELDKLPPEELEGWTVKVLRDEAQLEVDVGDESPTQPSGLHAKLFAIEHGHDVSWFVGSANLTAAAFTGMNVEMMARVVARKGRVEGQTGHGIERFIEGGFFKLCEDYRSNYKPEDAALAEGKKRIEAVRDALVDGNLRIACSRNEAGWQWTLHGSVDLGVGVQVQHFPVTVDHHQARGLVLPCSWSLPESQLTAFVAFVLRVDVRGVDEIQLTLKLPVEGMPDGRMATALRALIDSPERFLQFLRALLGGLDGAVDFLESGHHGPGGGGWDFLTSEAVLEHLIRTASREPQRLEPIRRLIEDLGTGEDGTKTVPADFMPIWHAVEQAVRDRGKHDAS